MRASDHWLKNVVVVTVSLINAVSMPGNATTSDPPRNPSSGLSPWSKSQATGTPVTRATHPTPSLPPPAQPFGPLSASMVTNASAVHTPACVAFSPLFKSYTADSAVPLVVGSVLGATWLRSSSVHAKQSGP